MPHLLLVDDDDLFRESLGLNLIDEGYEVTSFGNGREALAYFDHGGSADVVLLDWRMPANFGVSDRRFRLKPAGRFGPKRHPTARRFGAGFGEPPLRERSYLALV